MTDTEREFLKAVDGDNGRLHCPPMNVGRKFGAVEGGFLEGFVDNASYCIVRDGKCSRHLSGGSK